MEWCRRQIRKQTLQPVVIRMPESLYYQERALLSLCFLSPLPLDSGYDLSE